MDTRITLSATSAVEVERPLWGTTTDIIMNMIFTRRTDGHFSIWDNGDEYTTYRSKWVFDLIAADQTNLEALLQNYSYTGRDGLITLPLGTSATGWYPFGPTLGDKGTFTFKLTEPPTYNGLTATHPADMFGTEISAAMQSKPSYSFPSEIGGGTVALGNAAGVPAVTLIQFPLVVPAIEQAVNTGHGVTNDGTVYVVDRGGSADTYDAKFTFTLFEEKAMRVVNYLVGTARGNEWSIIAPANSYFFGNTSASGSYKVTLASPVISIKHVGCKRMEVSFMVHYKETL